MSTNDEVRIGTEKKKILLKKQKKIDMKTVDTNKDKTCAGLTNDPANPPAELQKWLQNQSVNRSSKSNFKSDSATKYNAAWYDTTDIEINDEEGHMHEANQVYDEGGNKSRMFISEDDSSLDFKHSKESSESVNVTTKIKRKMAIKKKRPTELKTGTIDANKYSIFGDVLADRKRNVNELADDTENMEVDLKQLLQKRKKTRILGKTLSTNSDGSDREPVRNMGDLTSGFKEEGDAFGPLISDTESIPVEIMEIQAEEDFNKSFGYVSDGDDARSVKSDTLIRLKRKLTERKDNRSTRKAPGTIDLNKFSKFGDGNVCKRKGEDVSEDCETVEVVNLQKYKSSLRRSNSFVYDRKSMEHIESSHVYALSSNEAQEIAETEEEEVPDELKDCGLSIDDASPESEFNRSKGETADCDEYDSTKGDKMIKIKSKFRKKKERKSTKKAPGTLDLNKFSRFGDGNVEKRKVDTIDINEETDENIGFKAHGPKCDQWTGISDFDGRLLSSSDRREISQCDDPATLYDASSDVAATIEHMEEITCEN